jgi:hypothetical protein
MKLEEIKNGGLEIPLPHFFDAKADSVVAVQQKVA